MCADCKMKVLFESSTTLFQLRSISLGRVLHRDATLTKMYACCRPDWYYIFLTYSLQTQLKLKGAVEDI